MPRCPQWTSWLQHLKNHIRLPRRHSRRQRRRSPTTGLGDRYLRTKRTSPTCTSAKWTAFMLSLSHYYIHFPSFSNFAFVYRLNNVQSLNVQFDIQIFNKSLQCHVAPLKYS